ncbi:MAG: hypothetical protein RMJ51_01625 [Candidatus Calescibacterium sp.]|nr:hypothetical protein [Candidatus Calescibacterium sp.]MCX7971815.1 hypothetical protein [bacterium]MDW8194929.1 hypothetical protein [Candidatus Calescibacterium sp.]
MMNLFKKNKSFDSLNSFSLGEYVYLLNYSNELINKYEQGLSKYILNNSRILIINDNNFKPFSNYITQILLNLKSFYCYVDIFEDIPPLIEFYDFAITIKKEINLLSVENVLYINQETFSVILALSIILNNRENSEKYEASKEEKEIIQNVDKKIVNHIIELVTNKKEYLNFIKNNEMGNKIEFIPRKELLFIVLGMMIILQRKI